MLYKLAFCLSGKDVTLYLDNSIAKVSLSKLPSHIFSLAIKYGITLNQTCILTNLNVEADYLSWGDTSHNGTFFLMYHKQPSCLGLS